MKPNLVFYVDHRFRDLLVLSKIAYKLKSKNNIFFLSNLHFDLIGYFDYAILLKPQLSDEISKKINTKKIRTKIFIIPSEGMLQDDGIVNPSFFPYFWFHWSEYEKNKYTYLEKKFNIKMKSIGNPRLDFIGDEKLKEIILNYYPVTKSNKKIVTIASSLHECFHDKETLKKKKKRWSKQYSKMLDYDLFVKNSHILLKILTNTIVELCEAHTDYTFILKPHPNEKIDYWVNFKKKINKSNFELEFGTNIINFIQNSKLHIAMNACTTIVEAKLSNVISVDLQTENSTKLYHNDHLNIADYHAFSKNDLLEIVSKLEDNKLKKKEIDNYYLEKYFNKKITNISSEYSSEIQKNISSDNIALINYLIIQIVVNSYIFKDLIKSIILKIKDKLNFRKFQKNIGKFNHRIRINEHKNIFKLFDKFNI